MSPKMWKVLLLVVATFQISFGARFEVGADYAYKSVQSAIDAAKDGDEVVIMDFAVYKEQVTIANKKNFILRSDNPKSLRKPTIQYQDTKNVGPETCDEAKVEEKINFDQNGALRVMRSSGVIIDGIKVDGGGASYFAYPQVWDGNQKCQHPLFHGNAAVVVWISGAVVVRNCDLMNSYFGISFKDRNEGGIYANANPADIKKWAVVPLSGFGKTGNHIVEYNRIHGNSWGIYFESTWDLGTVIRYNLIYENFQPTAKVTDIQKLTTEGANQIGGALFFKDHCLSPVAVYNNTFWHNSFTIVGHWRAGSQYLAFNNIFAEPNVYWEKNGWSNTWMVIDPVLVNRTYNSTYACQIQAAAKQVQNVQAPDPATNQQVVVPVTVYQPRIMNGMDQVERINMPVPIELRDGTIVTQTLQNVQVQGNRLIAASGGTKPMPFPAANNVRWLEPKFISTDPADPNFLVPDWEDSLINQFVVDQGWAGAGITDADGSPADLGAISKSGSRVANEVMIVPTVPVLIEGTTATAKFKFSGIQMDGVVGQMSNPVIKYSRWVNKIPNGANIMGNNIPPIEAADILNPTISNPLSWDDVNTLTFTVPARGAKDSSMMYSFLELVVEGKDPTGNVIQTAVGFLPYRLLEYKFVIEVWDLGEKNKLTEVKAGQPVKLKISALNIATNKAITAPIKPVPVSLGSGASIYKRDGTVLDTIDSIQVSGVFEVIFRKVPEGNGLEIVSASGIFKNPTDTTIQLAVMGTSQGIKILPGEPALVEFQDPPSKGKKVIDPGAPSTITAQVMDEFGNKINQQTDVVLTSLRTDVGNVVSGGAAQKTDSTGKVKWQVEVIEGNENDTFDITAQLVVKPDAVDKATIVVGKARDRLHVFYADSAKLDPSVVINECSSERVPVTIKRLANGTDLVDTMDVSFDIELSLGLAAYASLADTVKITSAELVKGKAVIWVKATSGVVSNGMITVYPVGDPSVLKGTRAGINFEECITQISSAAYFTDNGIGSVTRLEIRYKAPITKNEIPDSLELYWPAKTPAYGKMIRYDGTNMVLDPADSTHLTVYIREGFDSLVTTSFTKSLGTSYWKNKLLEDGEVKKFNLSINDSVGPLLTSATLIERIDPLGKDTLLLTFTEPVSLASVKDECLTLTKFGTVVSNLSVSAAMPHNGPDTIKVVIDNLGAGAPAGGDLLSILSSGSLTDQSGNKAHPENRPVTIKVRGVPPGITDAWYYDLDGDGIVETVVIDFNKKVDPANMTFKFKWSEIDTSSDIVNGATNASLSNPLDSSVVTVSIAGAFKDTRVINRTSGNMDVFVTANDYGVQIPASVKDKAAPVLISATYCPGYATSETQSEPDSFIVRFSEATHQMPTTMPFKFKSKSNGNGYMLVLDTLRNNTVEFIYTVKEIRDVRFPENGDSVWMMVDIVDNNPVPVFYDVSGNYQINPNNKKIPLIVKPIEYKVTVKVYPNPFTVGEKVRVVIKPITKMVEEVTQTLVAKLVIYDNIGNKVISVDNLRPNMTGVESTIPGAIEWLWDGRNSRGRMVAAGTYLGRVQYHNNGNGPSGDEKFFIGLRK